MNLLNLRLACVCVCVCVFVPLCMHAQVLVWDSVF